MVDTELGYIPYFDRESCDLDEFKVLTSQSLTPDMVPYAADVQKNVPIYDMNALRLSLADADARQRLLTEWGKVLGQSAGVIVLKSAYADTAVIDRATRVFRAIIADERASGSGEGDHFAAAGANDRIWNALQKHCLRDPEGFALYFGNATIAAACEAWLGPHYQMTAQVNQVRPGGKAQQAHRDYHLGFQSAEVAARFPAHAHLLTASLTLQGAIAHCDMPVDSGPTKLLPFSQSYGPGYLAFHDPAFAGYFEEACIQLPLEKGDAVFFNPALFHAAGENRTEDIERMANLVQISSAFGRAMESVDRQAMANAIFPALLGLEDTLSAPDLQAAIAATAEGYSFPTNLDTDPPVGGNAPQTQADILRQAVAEQWATDKLHNDLLALQIRQSA
ncbi:Ectoine hydroxylase-related dioxygenase, phytanoyl-CoA dioxygenase (PhyH) family [Aliiroseovarius halocynthiae]|uniref:Phytanoyl-CoA dioxygenase n=1 Tax=Aliiroseovarius halocynthiae TaxID=985055 RepID=A0A545SVT8_9RHOB|nr:phytanoyl-CoA dioxygenase family protein [Aliiroseovarius halocynthiae]TQV69073.1 phytanoyl-CoA dioxygenase [Aliiroseovarius halocynthiae]SMR71827.1 Ectoine hydroxylase-related dioxygenase, phytanoyl-CoA dioxygenase (PhyH) family [Aliiroseovarius halocynthiae]